MPNVEKDAERILEIVLARRADLLLASEYRASTTAGGGNLKGAWKPDLEPRWPKGTPGSVSGHPLGGTWMKVVDILGTIDQSISKSQNLTWLAKGSTRIQSINATREGDQLRMDITLKDGRSGQLLASQDAPFDKLMGRLVQIDSGQRVADQPQLAAPDQFPRRSPVPDLTVPEGTQPVSLSNLPIPSFMLAKVDAHKNDPRNKWPPDKGDRAIKFLGPFQHTYEMWTNAGGEFDPKREKFHKKIIAELLAPFEGQDPETDPTVMFTVGGPGSGKTTATTKVLDMPDKTLHLDNDQIKAMLPEYTNMTKGDPTKADPYAAYATHDEAAKIMQQIIQEAIQRGIHVHIDGTGDDNPGEFEKRMQTFVDAKYKVRVTLFDAPTDVGIYRTMSGASDRKGRYLDPKYTRDTYEKVARVFLGWKGKSYIADWRMGTSVTHGTRRISDVPNFKAKFMHSFNLRQFTILYNGDYSGRRFSTLTKIESLPVLFADNTGVKNPMYYNLFVQKAGGNHGRDI